MAQRCEKEKVICDGVLIRGKESYELPVAFEIMSWLCLCFLYCSTPTEKKALSVDISTFTTSRQENLPVLAVFHSIMFARRKKVLEQLYCIVADILLY